MGISNNTTLSLFYPQVIPRIKPKSTKIGSRNGWLCISGPTCSPVRIMDYLDSYRPKPGVNPELGEAGGGRGGQCIMATPTPPAPDQSHPDWLYLCINYSVDVLINRFDLTSKHNTPILCLSFLP